METKIALPRVPKKAGNVTKHKKTHYTKKHGYCCHLHIIIINFIFVDMEVDDKWHHYSRGEQVRNYYEKFKPTMEDMVRTFGVTEQMIRKHLKGVYESTRETKRDSVVELHLAGMTDYAIAKELGITPPAARWHVKKYYDDLGWSGPMNKKDWTAEQRERLNKLPLIERIAVVANLDNGYRAYIREYTNGTVIDAEMQK